MNIKRMLKDDEIKYMQSASGFIVRIHKGVSIRLNLKEIEEAKVKEDIIIDKKKFYTVYAPEIITLKLKYEEQKKILDEQKKLKEKNGEIKVSSPGATENNNVQINNEIKTE